MNKQQFIAKLRGGLSGKLSSATVEELAADFEAHFDEAVRAGQSEEEVCRILGDPMEIAEQCIDEYSDPSSAAEPSATMKSSPDTGYSAINLLHVKLLSYNLVCNPCSGDQFKIEIRKSGQISEDDSITISEHNGRLEIIQLSDYRSIIGFAFRMLEDKTIYVDVPVSFCGAMDIDIASGNCKLEDLPTCTKISCHVKSGNIKLEKIKWEKKLEAENLSGNIKLSDCQGNMALHCTSGNIKLEYCKGRCEAQSRSGNVRIKEHSGYVQASTLSGNLEVVTDEITENTEYNVKSGNISIFLERLAADARINCTSGNIHVTVGVLEGDIIAKTLSGNVIASLPYGTKANFDLKSNVMNRKQYSTAASEDGSVPTVALSSVSGNAKVREA